MGRLVDAPRTVSLTENAGGNANEYFERVAKYIPGEVLAGYLAVNGIIQSVDASKERALPAAAWGVFILCLFLTPIYFNQMAKPGQPKRLNMLVATIAFAVWAYALGGVFNLVGVYKPWLASILLVVFTLVSGAVVPKPEVASA
jgi:hypothetical protein